MYHVWEVVRKDSLLEIHVPVASPTLQKQYLKRPDMAVARFLN